MTQTLPFPQQQNNVSSNTTTTNKKNKDDELIRLALHRSSFFTCMDEEQIERFIDVAELKTFKDGQIIIQEGNRFDYEPSVSFSSAGKVTSSSIVSKEEEVDDNNDERQTLIIDEEINGDILSSPSPSVKDEWEQCDGDIGGRNINSHTTTITGEYSNITEQQYGTNNIYVIKENSVNVSHQGFNVASLGPGTVFGEGAILFNRSHSASVIAKGDETICWIVPAKIFREHVLPSKNMLDMFTKYVDVSTSNKDRPSEIFITMVCINIYVYIFNIIIHIMEHHEDFCFSHSFDFASSLFEVKDCSIPRKILLLLLRIILSLFAFIMLHLIDFSFELLFGLFCLFAKGRITVSDH